MREIRYDSNYHYQLKQDGDKILLVKFPTDCPHMGGEAFNPDDGEVVETFHEGEEVEFIAHTFRVRMTPDLADGIIRCGDDIQYILTIR